MESKFLIERKFVITILSLLITTGMLWAGRIGAPSFENIVIWLAGIFVLGEAASGWVQVLGIRTLTAAKSAE